MTKTRTSAPKRTLRGALAAGTLLLGAAGLSAGCLDRPVEPQSPNTSNVFVKTVQTSSIDKIDLLFMLDNSMSMADKQEILKAAVPNLLARLITPDCINNDGAKVDKDAAGQCPAGSKFEFSPVNDIHIGAITSSLGAHGGKVHCVGENTETTDPPWYPNDKAQLLPSVRGALTGPEFLEWNGGGQAEQTALVNAFRDHVGAASQNGCGFEASLEAWYRFLVDPNPPVDVVVDGNNAAVPQFVDPAVNTILNQRNAFLRSDSLVAIIMLSDENDCSIMDVGSGWRVTDDKFAFQAASEVCATEPNNKCCYSCNMPTPEGCSPSPACTGMNLPADQDRMQTRCAQQKKRFGIELLWPVDRYIDGLTQDQIWDWNGNLVQNPLFMARNGATRPKNLVFLAGIVGVPWQDLATEATLEGNALVYKSALEMRTTGTWDLILGDQGKGIMPTDPLMIESIAPRSGTHPITGEAIATTPWGNRINGNEYNNAVGTYSGQAGTAPNDDLQYACVFPLTTPLNCGPDATQAERDACDCSDNHEKGKPLCQNGAAGTQGTTQYYAKAYPGTRFLEVLKGIGERIPGQDNAIVASICPKNPVNASNATDPDAGYNPAVGAIIERLGEVLGGQCLPRELDIDEGTGQVPCYVIETSVNLGDPSCTREGREALDGVVTSAVRRQLSVEGLCGGITGIECSQFEMCAIRQFPRGAEQTACFTDPGFTTPGYCYIDPAKGADGGAVCDGEGRCENSFVKDCPDSQKRILRFVSGATAESKVPAANTITLTACVDS